MHTHIRAHAYARTRSCLHARTRRHTDSRHTHRRTDAQTCRRTDATTGGQPARDPQAHESARARARACTRPRPHTRARTCTRTHTPDLPTAGILLKLTSGLEVEPRSLVHQPWSQMVQVLQTCFISTAVLIKKMELYIYCDKHICMNLKRYLCTCLCVRV